MPESDAVLLERRPDHVAIVRLNRPAARNAVNGALRDGLASAVAALESDDDIRVVVLTGQGSAFCAGADLKEVAAGRSSVLRNHHGFAGFVNAPRAKPWIAAINGPALAGGCEIALACDLVVADPDAVLGLPEVTRGLAAAAGGLYRLVRALPPHVATELILTGDPMTAARAHAFGLVNRLAPAGQALDEAIGLARRIAGNGPLAVRESLRIARRAKETDEEVLRQLSDEAWSRIALSRDAVEGSLAFIEKRQPRWSGS